MDRPASTALPRRRTTGCRSGPVRVRRHRRTDGLAHVRRAVGILVDAAKVPAFGAACHDLEVCAEAFLRAAGALDARLSTARPGDDG